MMICKDVVTWASVVVQGGAAVLWITSTLVKVKAADVLADFQKTHGANSGPSQIITDSGDDFGATVERQCYWNKWAALATGLGVGLQAIATAIPTSP